MNLIVVILYHQKYEIIVFFLVICALSWMNGIICCAVKEPITKFRVSNNCFHADSTELCKLMNQFQCIAEDTFFACIYMRVVCMHICMSIHMYENIHVFMYMSEGQRFMSDVCFHFSPLILYVEVKSLMWTQCSQIQLIYQTSLLWSSLVSVPQSARTVNGLPAHQPCLWVMGKETQFLMLV